MFVFMYLPQLMKVYYHPECIHQRMTVQSQARLPIQITQRIVLSNLRANHLTTHLPIPIPAQVPPPRHTLTRNFQEAPYVRHVMAQEGYLEVCLIYIHDTILGKDGVYRYVRHQFWCLYVPCGVLSNIENVKVQ